jgi:hypothetical protein
MPALPGATVKSNHLCGREAVQQSVRVNGSGTYLSPELAHAAYVKAASQACSKVGADNVTKTLALLILTI